MFLRLFNASKAPAGRNPGIFFRQASANVLFRCHFKVMTEFFAQLVLQLSVSEKRNYARQEFPDRLHINLPWLPWLPMDELRFVQQTPDDSNHTLPAFSFGGQLFATGGGKRIITRSSVVI